MHARAHTHTCRWEEGRVAEMKIFEEKTSKKFLQITGINVELVTARDRNKTEMRRWSRGGRRSQIRS